MKRLALTLALLCAASTARAQDDATLRAPGPDVAAPAPTPTPVIDSPITERRSRPDFDGRRDPGPDAGEVLLWIPRIVFFPVTLVLDYGLRRPIGFLAETAERERWDALVLDLVTWNERRSGLLPTFSIAYGLQPSGGLLFFSNDDIAPGHSLGASFNFGGVDYLQGSTSYAISSRTGLRVELRGEGGRRPDRVFSGIGWDAQSVQYRFRETWYEAQLGARLDRFWRESRFEIVTGVDGRELGADGYAALADSPSVAEGIAAGEIQPPLGIDSGYAVSRTRMSIAIDTRELEPAPGHGVRVEAFGEMVFDLFDPARRQWARYGGGVGSFVDLGARRVIGLWGLARFADPLGGEDIPFTDLIALGDEALLMQGFLRGQLRGRSAVAGTLEYLYPVWTRLDGRLHVSVGNTFGAHLEDFAPERLRLSFGMGIATAGEPDGALELAVAAGTAPFVHGASIDSIQVVFGSRQGF